MRRTNLFLVIHKGSMDIFFVQKLNHVSDLRPQLSTIVAFSHARSSGVWYFCSKSHSGASIHVPLDFSFACLELARNQYACWVEGLSSLRYVLCEPSFDHNAFKGWVHDERLQVFKPCGYHSTVFGDTLSSMDLRIWLLLVGLCRSKLLDQPWLQSYRSMAIHRRW